MEISSSGAGWAEIAAADAADRGGAAEQAVRKSKATGHTTLNNERSIGIRYEIVDRKLGRVRSISHDIVSPYRQCRRAALCFETAWPVAFAGFLAANAAFGASLEPTVGREAVTREWQGITMAAR